MELGFKEIRFASSNLEIFHPGRQASIYAGELKIGSLGEIHPAIQRRLDVPQRILFAEFNLHDLAKVGRQPVTMQEVPHYPGSERDWTVLLEEDVPVETILNKLREKDFPLQESVSVIDLYRSDKLGCGKKSVTFRFVYRDANRTLEQEEVDQEHAKVLRALEA
jgi:phenylalanyl-tRNA synthetase beta chain